MGLSPIGVFHKHNSKQIKNDISVDIHLVDLKLQFSQSVEER